MKQKEVDERVELDDAAVLAIIEKALKQRKESITQYQTAGRQDLIDAEQAEIDVFLRLHAAADVRRGNRRHHQGRGYAQSGAAGPADMGKVIALVKPQVAGRADMGEVSKLVKAALA